MGAALGPMLPLLVDQLEEAIAGQPATVIDEWLEKAAAFLLECRSVAEPAAVEAPAEAQLEAGLAA